jgi:hypothetical protein
MSELTARSKCRMSRPRLAEKSRLSVRDRRWTHLLRADVRREGHDVTIFEAFHKSGGVMVYGIPEFRLPKVLVQSEAEVLESMGVDFELNFLVGRTRPAALTSA